MFQSYKFNNDIDPKSHLNHPTITGQRPIVFLLPGIQGSSLCAGEKTVWLSPMRIAQGGIKGIGTRAAGIRSTGLLQSRYGALAQQLRQKYDVVEFHYDWRKSTIQEATRLNDAVKQALDATQNTQQPIHFLAHSMGGIVARMLIARHRPTWERMIARGNGSGLVMLGTPNGGAASIVWSLIGKDRMIRLLKALDFRSSLADVLNEISLMPGLLELLPTDMDGRYYTTDTWDRLAQVAPPDWRPPTAKALAAALAARQQLTLQPEDAKHMAYIAGRARMTPVSIDVRQSGGSWHTRMIATKAGDGRVPWQTGQLSGVPTWYANSTNHRNLPKDPRLFLAINDLLDSGQTQRLAMRPAISTDESALFEVRGKSPLATIRGIALPTRLRQLAQDCQRRFMPHPAQVV